MNKYKRLTIEERTLIAHLYNIQKKTPTQISQELGRNRVTIYRELRLSKNVNDIYDLEAAVNRYNQNKTMSHRKTLRCYEKFIIYLENNFNKLCFGIDVCVAQSRKTRRKTPCTKTVYNWVNKGLISITPDKLLRKRKK